ncbi:MAG: tRNA pseudouridine(54/55) synthase Pus10 [Thermoplasmata archaeon]|nr:MAG: tRNA pseudouridine(54/55) synthase Pus10 [Thermoplasmata archaeon]
MQQILEEAKKIVSYKLCDSCLGRQFAKVEHGITNEERGKKIRELLGMEPVDYKECWLCQGLMAEIEKFADMVIEALKDYEFNTFLVGCKVDEEILDRENKIATPYAESIKREINREVGKLVAKKVDKPAEFVHPDIVAIVNTIYDFVELDVRPVYIYGRYRKLVRGIPQTKWYCRKCRGRGCEYCNYKGKMYEESVEELIAAKALEVFEAKDEDFHGAGREDIDVLMLGNGRPFILELKEPRKRNINLKELQELINQYAKGKIEVLDLRYASRSEIEKLKAAKYPKTYRVKIKFEQNGKINEAVNALRGSIIKQRTPKRVAHRRADKVRHRKIIDIRIEEIGMNEATLIITAESGTYIKELITGDEGRTTPSLSELAGVDIKVEELDVINIGDKDEEIERI